MMWQEKDGQLYRKFEFKDFKQAFAFMTKVAAVADQMDHHPTWTNTYNKVEVWLSTHSAGDQITEKDRQLAEKIDRLYSEDA
jgi:4a-hydroxytetrahydrobiopterin dehydratase